MSVNLLEAHIHLLRQSAKDADARRIQMEKEPPMRRNVHQINQEFGWSKAMRHAANLAAIALATAEDALVQECDSCGMVRTGSVVNTGPMEGEDAFICFGCQRRAGR